MVAMGIVLVPVGSDIEILDSLLDRDRIANERPLRRAFPRKSVDKDSREQFEIRTHKRLIDVLDPNASHA